MKLNKKKPTIEERGMRPIPKRRNLSAQSADERIAREQEREEQKKEE